MITLRPLSRRQWLATAAALGVAGLASDAFLVEPGRVTVTRHRLGATTGRPARLVQLTDLHLQEVGRHEEHVAEAVAELSPDLVLITGDAIDKAGHVGLLGSFMDLLDARTPKLAIFGNWEHWSQVDPRQLDEAYSRRNCQLLRNESVAVTMGGHTLLVTGLDDLVSGAPDLPAALRGHDWQPNHLLLAHCPAQRDVLSAASIGAALPLGSAERRRSEEIDPRLLHPPYMLAGHTHGGQIALFGYAPLRPRGSGRYVSGWYRDASTALYVSRGIGTSVIPARFGSPPEVACFDWVLS